MNKRLLIAIAAASTLTMGAFAHAGGPFVVDEVNFTGAAQTWQSNDTLEWYADKGPLSSGVDNAEAVALVQELLGTWTGVTIDNASGTAVSTTVAKANMMGTLDEDIDETNYEPFIFSNDETRTVVIFDDDGKITEALGMDSDGIVGLSQPLLGDAEGLHITKGFALLNGKVLNNNRVTIEQFKAAILHELGHLLNLDHTQVNHDIATTCTLGKACPGGNYIPTMYPELLTDTQVHPTRDDEIAISWIHPSADFSGNFCTITGEIFDASGNPLKGVNVIAMRVKEGDTATKVDTRSFVSGVLRKATETYPVSSAKSADCVGDARYYLYGILPGHEYQVMYEPIATEFTGASSLEPLDPAPSGFDSGYICPTSADASSGCDTYTVKCDSGGQTVEMASATIDTTNRCTYKSSAKASTASKCSLAPVGGASPFECLFLLVAAAAIAVRRRRSG